MGQHLSIPPYPAGNIKAKDLRAVSITQPFCYNDAAIHIPEALRGKIPNELRQADGTVHINANEEGWLL